MNRNWKRNVAVATALSAALTLAAPAQASGWTLWAPGPDFARTAWQWIARLWPAAEGTGRPGSCRRRRKAAVAWIPTVYASRLRPPNHHQPDSG